MSVAVSPNSPGQPLVCYWLYFYYNCYWLYFYYNCYWLYFYYCCYWLYFYYCCYWFATNYCSVHLSTIAFLTQQLLGWGRFSVFLRSPFGSQVSRFPRLLVSKFLGF